MEGFSYSDIFATKGIEYLVIIAFLVLLIPFSIIFKGKNTVTAKRKKSPGTLSPEILRILPGLFYAKNHTWMYMEKSGDAKVGLDDLLLHIIGKIELRTYKNSGELVHKGDLLAEIHQDGKLLKILSPVSGIVMDINPAVQKKPSLLNEDPYNKGWILKIKPSKWIVEADDCYFGEGAKYWAKYELQKFRDFLSVSVKNSSPDPTMMILQDGGELCDHFLSGFSGEIWTNFEKEFLNLHPY